MSSIMLIKDNCPFCAETDLAIFLHNSNSDPDKWIEIIDSDSGDPRADKILNLLGKNPVVPTGILKDNILVNFVIDKTHFYEFLRVLFR